MENIIVEDRSKFVSDANYAEYLRNLRNKNPKVDVLTEAYRNFLEDWATRLIEEKHALEKERRTP